MLDAQIISGPLWAGRNWAAAAGSGSIHDDDTASNLGFRGGTVPGDVHLNQFVPVLLQLFGDAWFERGNLSINFKNATVDGERVRVSAETVKPLAPSEPADAPRQARVWMEREDGLLVCQGTAALSDFSHSELRQRDLRPSDSAQLKILSGVSPGADLGSYPGTLDSKRQVELYDAALISDPLPVYRNGGSWLTDQGQPALVACPSTLVQKLWGLPMAGLRPLLQDPDAVGLFGAIEIGQPRGPLLLDQDYRVSSKVVCVGQSPKTEYLWFDSWAHQIDEDPMANRPIAELRMMLRFMKASSKLY